ncbi:microfibrillar-associated protein 4 [Halocaridina rubra]|uniref:Microfibrillar-associated protein 4 n=1 Tax=Halocaridina rubra TaxID=373956 RepID=A0AAN8WTS2_HALRR
MAWRLVPATVVLILLRIALGSNGPTVSRSATVPRLPSQSFQSNVASSLDTILSKLEANHRELTSSISEMTRVARETQMEMTDLQEDMELLLGQMYKPSCQEIAQDQHEGVAWETNKASVGVFTVKPPKYRPTEVRCEIERGAVGWTVMLSRTNGIELFNRTYKEYQEGFGHPTGDYWIGNDFLHRLTTWKPHQLRVVMEDWDGQKTWAQYNRFRVAGPEDSYRITIEQFEADSAAGDGMEIHNGMLFSTYDRDDDNNKDGNCAQLFGGGGGWWYNNCYHVLPTGRYRSSGGMEYGGVAWYPWRSVKHSLKAISLLLRRSSP